MTAPVPQAIRAFKHQKQPTDDASFRQWMEMEIQRIQNTLNDLIAAVKQLQTFTGV
jgi:hypothetical protein